MKPSERALLIRAATPAYWAGVLQALRGAKNLVQLGWTQGRPKLRTKTGDCYCLWGAYDAMLEHVGGKSRLRELKHLGAVVLAEQIALRPIAMSGFPPDWGDDAAMGPCFDFNDSSETTQEDVVKLLASTIAKVMTYNELAQKRQKERRSSQLFGQKNRRRRRR